MFLPLHGDWIATGAICVGIGLFAVTALYVASRCGGPRRSPAPLPPEISAACHDAVARALAPDRPVVPVRGVRIRIPATVH